MEKEIVSAPARPRAVPGGDILTFPNGATLKRHNQQAPASPPGLYRECLKNHAALLGGHALDGCGEFMPSPHAVPSDPSSLKCAACGCHRNFHRRDDDPAADPDHDPDPAPAAAGELLTPKRRSSSSASPPRPPPQPISSPYFTSAPHMLLALSTGATGPGPAHSAAPIGRKRFRTKFSREQKERMQLFAEKLGWRFQKQEEKLVEEFCNEIGVAKGVLKVWMHNNKHAFVKKDHEQQLFHGSNGNGSFNNESSNGFGTSNTNGTTATAAHVFNGSSSSS